MRIMTRLSGTIAIALLAGGVGLMAQATGETFSATATVKSPKASGSAPVTIHVDRLISVAERDKFLAVVKNNDQAASRAALAAMPDVGYIELDKKRTPVKYAFSRSTGAGRLITVATAEPIRYLGGAAPDAKPKEGYYFALAFLILDGADKGDGELAPAAKVKMNDQGAIVTDDYGAEVVRLINIAKVK
jgi:hypothetical protein